MIIIDNHRLSIRLLVAAWPGYNDLGPHDNLMYINRIIGVSNRFHKWTLFEKLGQVLKIWRWAMTISTSKKIVVVAVKG